MMRSFLKLSCVLLVTSLFACSSKSDEGTGNSGGSNGSSGGTSSSSGGTSSSSGGTSSSSGGTCNGTGVTCLDSTKAQGCNPETGMVETIDCAMELEPIGVVSSGCMKDETGEGCQISGFKDQPCADGVATLIACNYISTNSDAIDAYASCFLHDKNMNGQDIHELITCVGTEIASETPTTGDCTAATETCVGADIGAGGSGAGGAAP